MGFQIIDKEPPEHRRDEPPNEPTIYVWRGEFAPDPYPWMFAIAWRGNLHSFVGIPNSCETRRSAVGRAVWRARWMLDGSYARRYQ